MRVGTSLLCLCNINILITSSACLKENNWNSYQALISIFLIKCSMSLINGASMLRSLFLDIFQCPAFLYITMPSVAIFLLSQWIYWLWFDIKLLLNFISHKLNSTVSCSWMMEVLPVVAFVNWYHVLQGQQLLLEWMVFSWR